MLVDNAGVGAYDVAYVPQERLLPYEDQVEEGAEVRGGGFTRLAGKFTGTRLQPSPFEAVTVGSNPPAMGGSSLG